MGDRAHIVVTGGDSKVWLYTHWSGSEIEDVVRAALKRSRDRWDDVAYLGRVIFCEMVKDDVAGTTGFGIASRPCEDEDRDIVVDTDSKTVKLPSLPAMPFDKFVGG